MVLYNIGKLFEKILNTGLGLSILSWRAMLSNGALFSGFTLGAFRSLISGFSLGSVRSLISRLAR